MSRTWIDFAYLVAAICFVIGIKRLSHPRTARSGNWIAAVGMAIAVGFTFLVEEIDAYWLMLSGIAVGTVIGVAAARMVRMTAIPQMVALFNGVGGGAAALIAAAEFHRIAPLSGNLPGEELVGILFSALVGSVSFWGSLVAFGKLQELVPGRPIVFPAQNLTTALLGLTLAGAIALTAITENGIWLARGDGRSARARRPVRPADRRRRHARGDLAPERVHGARRGLDRVRARQHGADHRRHARRRFGNAADDQDEPGDGPAAPADALRGVRRGPRRGCGSGGGGDGDGSVRTASADDIGFMLAYARRVIFVPGYGLAVAQAQHDVRNLGELLESKGVDVRYAIHPVAGRMPGHMNVLLAEANVPYDELFEMDEINPEFPQTDVVVVVGANDVVNPAARNQPGYPIYGMPILDADKAHNVVVIKRSLSPGSPESTTRSSTTRRR